MNKSLLLAAAVAAGACPLPAAETVAFSNGATRTWNGQGDGLRWSGPDN